MSDTEFNAGARLTHRHVREGTAVGNAAMHLAPAARRAGGSYRTGRIGVDTFLVTDR